MIAQQSHGPSRVLGGGQLRVVQGANAWRIIRTDRDGASRHDIPQMTAAVLRYWLTGAHEFTPNVIPTGSKEWRFGPVRPLQVASVSHKPQALPAGKVLAERQTALAETIPTVAGKQPWYVMVYFWWRKPPAIIPYPGFKKGWFGPEREYNAADYILDEARAITGMHDPGDQTWLDAMGGNVSKAAKGATEDLAETVLPTAGLGIGLLVALWLLSQR